MIKWTEILQTTSISNESVDEVLDLLDQELALESQFDTEEIEKYEIAMEAIESTVTTTMSEIAEKTSESMEISLESAYQMFDISMEADTPSEKPTEGAAPAAGEKKSLWARFMALLDQIWQYLKSLLSGIVVTKRVGESLKKKIEKAMTDLGDKKGEGFEAKISNTDLSGMISLIGEIESRISGGGEAKDTEVKGGEETTISGAEGVSTLKAKLQEDLTACEALINSKAGESVKTAMEAIKEQKKKAKEEMKGDKENLKAKIKDLNNQLKGIKAGNKSMKQAVGVITKTVNTHLKAAKKVK